MRIYIYNVKRQLWVLQFAQMLFRECVEIICSPTTTSYNLVLWPKTFVRCFFKKVNMQLFTSLNASCWIQWPQFSTNRYCGRERHWSSSMALTLVFPPDHVSTTSSHPATNNTGPGTFLSSRCFVNVQSKSLRFVETYQNSPPWNPDLLNSET